MARIERLRQTVRSPLAEETTAGIDQPTHGRRGEDCKQDEQANQDRSRFAKRPDFKKLGVNAFGDKAERGAIHDPQWHKGKRPKTAPSRRGCAESPTTKNAGRQSVEHT